ncbi:MAG: PIG-L family deacetylase [Bacteroidota bacterium]
MIVVAHPDDEILGLGATMNKLINEYNVDTRVVILGEGITSRSFERDEHKWKSELEVHQGNILAAKKMIGYHDVKIYNFPDNRFDQVALLDIIKIVEKEKSDFAPDVIFTHHGGDVNIDHQRTFESVITACRPMTGETVKTIITFETFSGTEWRASTDPRHFIPTIFVSLDKVNLDAKIKAMECYEFERRDFPHPRSSKAMEIVAQRWGIIVGANYAEAFCLVRNIII